MLLPGERTCSADSMNKYMERFGKTFECQDFLEKNMYKETARQ